ncbi:carbohydrate kinase [Microvirga sp. BT688]|uniref:FGGY-family carbohydrate kinase n=1 Tax=Microvirga sp. TaxID=1873136 RepID=UPI0016849074|nr:FGGY-family carbohydrate kinase [Microvirga sp.]MBD2746718.1 carbohydrate kinase [Microvirga sp.]
MSYVLGIDKGTTATKAVVINAETGQALGTARRQTPSYRPKPDWHEEDMEVTFDGVALAIRGAIEASGVDPAEIAAVGVSGHMGGLWALDSAGKPVGRAIAWPDARAASMLEGWNEDGRTKRLYEICGNAPIPGLPLVLLSYIRQHEPERYARIATVFCAKDYINYRLTGEIAMDESDLSFFPCDIRGRKVSPELLELAGVPKIRGRLPRILGIGNIVGRVMREAAAQTGLAEGTPVVTGAGDAVAAAIGVGALEAGQAVTVIGTSFMNNLTVDRPMMEPENVGFLFLMPEGRWQRLMSNTGGGSLCLDWIISAFCQAEPGSGNGNADAIFERIEQDARAVPPLAHGLLIHPYFNTSGMSAPRHEPAARGSIFGLDMATQPMTMVRAVMEGVALSMVECYAALDAPVNEIRITGGGARSKLWREICAAAMNRELMVPEVEETGALGVAMLGATAVGVHDSLTSAAERMVRIAEQVTPDPGLAERYQAAYPLFRDLGRDLTPLWKHRAALLQAQEQQDSR